MHTSIRGLVAATLLAGTALAATPAFADDAPASQFTITGSAAIVSQYRFRGISQSDQRPAVQGAITVSHSSGLYIATWGSSASAGNSAVNIGGTEIDVYGGFTHAIGDSGVTFDGGVYGYLYPGATIGNYYEVYGSLAKTFGPVTAKVGAYFAPKQKATKLYAKHDNTYIYGELGAGIPNTPVSIHSHLGYTTGSFEWTKKYIDYNVGVTYKWKNLAFDVSYVGTNVGHSDATGEVYRAIKPVPVFSVTASF